MVGGIGAGSKSVLCIDGFRVVDVFLLIATISGVSLAVGRSLIVSRLALVRVFRGGFFRF